MVQNDASLGRGGGGIINQQLSERRSSYKNRLTFQLIYRSDRRGRKFLNPLCPKLLGIHLKPLINFTKTVICIDRVLRKILWNVCNLTQNISLKHCFQNIKNEQIYLQKCFKTFSYFHSLFKYWKKNSSFKIKRNVSVSVLRFFHLFTEIN